MNDYARQTLAFLADRIAVTEERLRRMKHRYQRIQNEEYLMTHAGLPVAGYKPQSDDKVQTVNAFKQDEERILRKIDDMMKDDTTDKRWLAIGRTQLEQAFMAINRSVFQPGRVSLREDAE